MLLQHLAQAERHIALGDQHLARQEALIAELDCNGHDTDGAKQVLATMRQSQALHVDARDRILGELNDLGS